MNRYRDILGGYDLSTFPKLKEKDVRALEDALSLDIPQLVKQVILTATSLTTLKQVQVLVRASVCLVALHGNMRSL